MKYVAASLLIIFCVYHLYEDHKKEQTSKEQYNDIISKYQLQQDEFRSQQQQWWSVRDSLTRANTISLTNISLLTASNRKLEVEMKNIKGRYSRVSEDSLGLIMDQRAWRKNAN